MGQLTGLAGIIRGARLPQMDDDSHVVDEPTVVAVTPIETRAQKGKVEEVTAPEPRPTTGAARQVRAKGTSLSPENKAVPKSKDPAWKGYSLFLKKETHAEMNFLLRKQDAGEDMSDLVQRLVEKWVVLNR